MGITSSGEPPVDWGDISYDMCYIDSTYGYYYYHHLYSYYKVHVKSYEEYFQHSEGQKERSREVESQVTHHWECLINMVIIIIIIYIVTTSNHYYYYGYYKYIYGHIFI